MQVEFHKTGERRYAVIIRRDGLADLKMDPAPGFDALMPHDMLHFLVEQELGLRRGIFGQLAHGTTAGTFRLAPSEAPNARADARLRRKTARQGKKTAKDNTDEYLRSERATYFCLYDWFAHSTDETRCARASEMKITFDSIRAQMTEDERQKFTKEKLARIRTRMDELSRQWSALKVGESMKLEWSPR
jgi:hypothetical protein